MPTLWRETDRTALLARLARLTPDTTPRWGRFTCPQMLAHLGDALRMATGDLPVAARRTPLRYPPLKQLVLYWLPIPKSVPTAPELLARVDTAEFARERAKFPKRLEQFTARPRQGHWPDHPAFGTMSGTSWGVLSYRHIDHHFTQFGV